MGNYDFDYLPDGIIYYFELKHGVGTVRYTSPTQKKRRRMKAREKQEAET